MNKFYKALSIGGVIWTGYCISAFAGGLPIEKSNISNPTNTAPAQKFIEKDFVTKNDDFEVEIIEKKPVSAVSSDSDFLFDEAEKITPVKATTRNKTLVSENTSTRPTRKTRPITSESNFAPTISPTNNFAQLRKGLDSQITECLDESGNFYKCDSTLILDDRREDKILKDKIRKILSSK